MLFHHRSEAQMSAMVTMCEAALMAVGMCLPLGSDLLPQFGREDGYTIFSGVFGLVGKHSYFNNHPALVSRLLHIGVSSPSPTYTYAYTYRYVCEAHRSEVAGRGSRPPTGGLRW